MLDKMLLIDLWKIIKNNNKNNKNIDKQAIFPLHGLLVSIYTLYVYPPFTINKKYDTLFNNTLSCDVVFTATLNKILSRTIEELKITDLTVHKVYIDKQLLCYNGCNYHWTHYNDYDDAFFSSIGKYSDIAALDYLYKNNKLCDNNLEQIFENACSCESSNPKFIEYLLKIKPNLIKWVDDSYCICGFFLASSYNNLDIVKILVKQGIDINMQNYYHSDTALHYAVKNNSIRVIGFLIANGAKINLHNKSGKTPVYEALCYCNTESVKIFEEHGANIDVNMTDNYGETPIYNAVLFAANSNNNEIIQNFYMLYEKANIDVKNKDGITPVLNALMSYNIEAIGLLAKLKADINIPDNDGMTPLHYAAKQHSRSTINMLISLGANINKCNNHNQTPIHIAAIKNNIETICALILHKADINIKDNDNNIPLFSAIEKGNTEAVDKLIMHDNKSIYTQNNNGETPLFIAAKNGHPMIVEKLYEYGKQLIDCPNKDGITPLHIAIHNSHTSVVNTLINYKANIEIPDNDGITPEQTAKQNDNKKIKLCFKKIQWRNNLQKK